MVTFDGMSWLIMMLSNEFREATHGVKTGAQNLSLYRKDTTKFLVVQSHWYKRINSLIFPWTCQSDESNTTTLGPCKGGSRDSGFKFQTDQGFWIQISNRAGFWIQISNRLRFWIQISHFFAKAFPVSICHPLDVLWMFDCYVQYEC